MFIQIKDNRDGLVVFRRINVRRVVENKETGGSIIYFKNRRDSPVYTDYSVEDCLYLLNREYK